MSDLGSRFVVADSHGALLDLMAQMRREDVEVAVVTANGALEKPEDILGVIDWNDIARSSELPLSILLRKPKVAGGA
jgi:hypothetical protein